MNYYNDNDPFSSKWLKALIESGLIPKGDVDDRSITEIKPSDLIGYTQCHFFAGIGGWPYALDLAGWPRDRKVWTGSCPCQPFSVAGKGEGIDDERHLWPAFRWLIARCRPSTVFGEQVASKDGREWLSGVRVDLEAMGYEVGAADLCAAGVGAPNIRQRLWWVADSSFERRQQDTGSSPCDEKKNGGTRRNQIKQNGYNKLTGYGKNNYGMADSDGFNDDRAGLVPGDDGGERETEKRLSGIEIDFRMANADRIGQKGKNESPYEKQKLDGREAGRCRRLGDTEGERFGKEGECLGGSAPRSPWSESKSIHCRDGKQRRIPAESALFPLAPRLPQRVGLLRGAGNSINPWVAAEFVAAFMGYDERG